MSITLNELINRAYYLSGKVARGLETVSREDSADGLFLLNNVLSRLSINNRNIPFYARYEFNTVAGQESYFINNLINFDPITFNINTVRFALLPQTRDEYFGQYRVDNVQTLPGVYHSEREKGGTRIYLYPVPAQVYVIKLSGKFFLTSVSRDDLQDNLLLTYEQNYIDYLRYLLAKEICVENVLTFSPQHQQQLEEYEKMYKDISPMDLSLRKQSMFTQNDGFNWGMANLFKGYYP